MESSDKSLFGIRLFHGLAPDELKELAARCHWHRFGAGQQILSHRDDSTDIYFIIGGQVRATIYSRSGKEVAFRDLGPGESFGELSAIDNKPRAANVVAVSDSLIVSMPSSVFWDVLLTHSLIASTMLKQLSDLTRLLTERIIEFSTLGVRNRIHAELLRLSRKQMRSENVAELSPAPTHAEIASRISTHREAVTRELNELTRAGLIERRSGTLYIHDVNKLKQIVEEVVHE